MSGNRKNKILIVAYPKPGHINPALRFANRLLNLGVEVTFSTSFSAIQHFDTDTTRNNGLTFAPFSDGHDDEEQPTTTLEQFISDFTTHGVSAVSEIITTAVAAGQSFDHLVYTTTTPWAAKVAHAHGLESTLLWCQPAIVLGVYYYYFNGYEDLISCNNINPTFPINLPGLSSLTIADLPSFLVSSCPKEHEFVVQLMKDHIDALKITPRVLVNTFKDLEMQSITAIEKLVMIPVGPLTPSELLNERGQSLVCDLFKKPEEDYINWLNTKPKSSVVYVAFGSITTLTTYEAEEMASGLLKSERPFLWVINIDVVKFRNIEVVKKQGMIVRWCSQVEVLNHQAVGCFLTHCGWNSTTEALAAGVPTVAFPQWSDQMTIAKMIEDVWKTGVKVKKREDEPVDGKEIKRCVEMVMKDGEIRVNAERLRELARQARDNGGSSNINLQAFLNGS